MVDQLLEGAKAAIFKRNPPLEPLLRPGIAAGVIRKTLTRAGIVGNVEDAVAIFSHFDGADFPDENNEAYRLGFAPPIVRTIELPAEARRILEASGTKVDPHQTIYDTFYFPRWEGVARGLKTRRKFASNPRNGVLVGRVVPFFVYGGTHQELAFDTDPSADGRIISIQTDKMKDAPPLAQPYESLEEFLRDLIDANQNNRHLAWPTKLGPPVELPMPAAPKVAAKSKKPALPATDRVLLVRTDFSNDAGWQALRAALGGAHHESGLSVEFVSDPAFAGLTAKQIPKQLPDGHKQPIAVLADEATFAADDQTLVVVDLQDKPGRSFRTTPACLHEVYDNLSVANVEFAEFVKAAKGDGVFRGSGE